MPDADFDDAAGVVIEPDTFDRDYVEKLRAEAAKYRTEAKANAAAAVKLAELESQSQTTEQKYANALQEAQTAQLKALRYEVAVENGLDLKLAARLTGDTKEALAADAVELKNLLQPKAPDGPTVKPASKLGVFSLAEPASTDKDPLLAELRQQLSNSKEI